jgi:replicative DNA helicase
MTETHTRLADAFDDWRSELLNGKPPERFAVAENGPLTKLDLRPGRVWVIGGHPGAGKTAFVMQLVVDALSLQDNVTALVMNVEMEIHELLNRQLARLSGIPLDIIQQRQFTPEHTDRLEFGFDALADIRQQLIFARPPFRMDRLIQAADTVSAQIVVADYIQRIQLDDKPITDRRMNVDACVDMARQMANCGLAVIAVAALARQKGRNGSDYEDAGLASFRESSELEYGADDAFIMATGKRQNKVYLQHLKARHAARVDITLDFDGKLQRFTAADNAAMQDAESDAQDPSVMPTDEIRALWES